MTDRPFDLNAGFAKVLESGRGSEMAVRLRQSLEVTDGLWELVPVVVAATKAHEQRSPVQVADSSLAAEVLAGGRRALLRKVGDALSEATATATGEHPIDESALAGLTAAEITADPFGIADSLMDPAAYVARVFSALGPDLMAQLGAMSADEASYLAAYLQAADQQPRAPVLLRAVFAAAVATVEPLVTRMVLLLLHEAAPDAYASLADPELDSKARSLCYGSPAKWRKALVGTLGVNVLADIVDWEGLGLLWEARNVIAHRGGLVDARYQAKSNAEIGSLIASEHESVCAAIDEIGAARFAIVAGVWDHLARGIGSQIADSACIPLWNSLRAGRWRQASGLARVEEAFAQGGEAIATAKVHRWLAVEQGYGPEATRDAVRTWDVTALPATFQLARHLLLHQDHEALAILHQLINDGTVGPAELLSWPLFDRVRQAGLLSGLLDPVDNPARPDAITEDRYRKLTDLAAERVRDAEACAMAGCYAAACVMAGAGIEAAIMAHVCFSAAEVHAAGRWRGTRSAPFDWSLEHLIQIAVAMSWLPATRTSIPNEEAVEKLAGRVGDAVRFVQYARNLVVHPGKYALEAPWLAALGQDEYTIVYGVTRSVIDHLYAALTGPDGGT
ncbi:MAG: hypothetical protein ACRDPY_42820 [Streptosporangiaceae bacterium]